MNYDHHNADDDDDDNDDDDDDDDDDDKLTLNTSSTLCHRVQFQTGLQII